MQTILNPLLLVLFIGLSLRSFSQDKPAYVIFTSDGKPTDYGRMIKAVSKSEVVFFGESHNDPISHWLEVSVLKDIYAVNKDVVLAMEMFEADNQLVLDEYVTGLIDEKQLLKEAKIWNNYATDYKPMIEFAKQNKLQVVASNIPRRYANLIYRKGMQGLDSVAPDAKRFIAPLPFKVDLELKGYKDMIKTMGGHGGGSAENIALAQASKDATMAYFISKYKNQKNVVYHVNGSYHSKDHEGIIWYLKTLLPKVNTATIHVAEQKSIDKLDKENIGLADFIICVAPDMTKTY